MTSWRHEEPPPSVERRSGLSATDLLAAYQTRSLSPVDVVGTVLDRVGVWDTTLNALWTVETEAAPAAARASEKRRAEGQPVGALDGASVTLKENIATKGTASRGMRP